MKRNDFILIGVIIVLALSILLYNNFQADRFQEGQLFAEVYYDGELIEKVSLLEEKEIEIAKVGHNIIQIRNGKVEMIEADCPDKICLLTGEVSTVNQSIVCLPNKVHVQITGDMESDVDAIVQ